MHLTNVRERFLRWLLAGACCALLLFVFSPSWGAFRLWSRVPEMEGMLEVRRGASVLQQVADPGAPIADPLHAAIQWRLLFPLLGHVLDLPPAILFSLAHVGCLILLAYIITHLRRAGLAWFDCALAALVLGSTSWFFTSTGWLGYYDSWLALALLLVAFSPRSWVMWLAFLWAPWIDERFVIAAPLALLCRYLWISQRMSAPASSPTHTVGTSPAPASFIWQRDAAIPLALLTLFVVVRLLVLSGRSGDGATLGGYLHDRHFLDASWLVVALGIWEGLRTSWIFVGGAFLLLWHPRSGLTAANRSELAHSAKNPFVLTPQTAVALLASATLATIAIGLATAQDYSRSMTMILPVALLGLLLASQQAIRCLPRVLRIAAFIALILPAHHVMNDRVNPIYYLYHELAALRSPPPGAMPELYELRAIHEMERGDFAQANAHLTLAIKLAANPASPSRQRGILFASQGRWADALQDFSTALDHDPDNPEAWFMRAQAYAAVGNATAARADIDHALSLAPNGWSSRPDVTRFLAKLNRAP